MRAKVLFIDKVHPAVWRGLEDMGYACLDGQAMDSATLKAELSDAVGAIVRHRLYLGEELLKDAQALRWIGRSGVGLDAIDTSYCAQKGIIVVNGAGGNADAVGEHVIGMLLALMRNLNRADREVRDGIWQREVNRGRELGNCVLGIIGYGNTGRALARKISGFGTRVLAYDKYQPVSGSDANEVSLEELQAHSDIISFHVPLTEETTGYFDHAFLAQMDKPFYLVNAARGPVCDLAAVAGGLSSNKILGAALDVLPKEPKDGARLDADDTNLKALLRDERILFSPHIAGWTTESYENLAQILLERIRAISI